MSQQRAVAARPLPPLLIGAACVAVVGHFFTILMLVLAAQSGPWATRFGESTAEGPLFAAKVTNWVTRDERGNVTFRGGTMPWYLEPLHMTHNYHFGSNRLMM